MRNTKVIDVIEELKDFGVNIDVYDPWVDQKENEWYKYGIIDNPLESDKRYDSVIIAVGHKQFKKYTDSDYKALSNGEGVIIDIKNISNSATWTL
jgi:UDP-N-acetyl-D-glucosamine/UDP-N-acetyl-D-galactosamine dehydrogenase